MRNKQKKGNERKNKKTGFKRYPAHLSEEMFEVASWKKLKNGDRVYLEDGGSFCGPYSVIDKEGKILVTPGGIVFRHDVLYTESQIYVKRG